MRWFRVDSCPTTSILTAKGCRNRSTRHGYTTAGQERTTLLVGQRKKILPIGKEFLFFFLFFIFLHAMAMSEGTDNTGERGLVYGIAPDRNRWVEYANDTDNTI